MQPKLIRAPGRALLLAAALASLPASAVLLGELQVDSALGEALDARIPLGNSDGRQVDAACFSLGRAGGDGLPVVGEGILTVERTGDRPALRVRSLARIYEPAVLLRVRAACPGESGAVMRQYSVLLDPRPAAEVAPNVPVVARAQSPSVSVPPEVPVPTVASLSARPGDTLQSIAATVFPGNAAAQARYLAALREANPAFERQPANEALPRGAPVTLPDLRTYARAAVDAARETSLEPGSAGSEPAAAVATAPRTSTRAATRRPPAAPPAEAAAPRGPSSARQPGGGGFVLKLSSSEMDLSRSQEIDDRMRAQLRERLMVLDADDQVSALLAMRNSLRQLENRVADLQLKLAAMPAALANLNATAPAATREGMTGSADTPAAGASPPPSGTRTEVLGDAATAAPTAAAPPAAAPASEAAGASSREVAPPRPAVQPPPEESSPFRLEPSPWLWGLVALLAGLALLLAWRLRQRRQLEQEAYEPIEPGMEPEDPALMEAEGELDEPAVARAAVSSDAALATRLGDDSAELRRRYIEERFPEVASGTIALGDADSVVKGARLFYEDGAVERAVELLRFGIDENPGEVRTWLALFEIFRLESRVAEFSRLAGDFFERHEASGYWRKVQFIGREIDPGNPLYAGDSFNNLETIGPAAARRMAADTFDPLVENWLDAPMDFQNEVLADELRRGLMAEAGISEEDLAPNPMPALRNAETFTLA